MVLLDNDKARLWAWRDWVAEQLATVRLRLHPDKAAVSQVKEGLDLLGYRVFPERQRLRNENGLRFRRRLRRFAQGYAEGWLDWADFDPSVQAWIGHACHQQSDQSADAPLPSCCHRARVRVDGQAVCPDLPRIIRHIGSNLG